jgi:PAS domain S-box-containing protein
MANYSRHTVPMEPETPATDATSQRTVNLPTGGIRTAFHTGTVTGTTQSSSLESLPKRQKVDPIVSSSSDSFGIPAQQLSLPTSPPLGWLHPGAVLAAQQLLQSHATAVASMHHQPQQQQQAERIALPVGVGIRLGGVGGIAPSTAQSAPGAQSSVVQQYSMWGAADSATSGDLSDHAAAERRERNREHAKRSRVRKKFMLESLQEQVLEMQRENQRLRMLVQKHIPEHAMQIIAENCTEHPLFQDHEDSDDDSKEAMVRADYTLMRSLATGQKCFVLSDPKLPDNPIIFASSDFYKLTGYTSKEVLGRNCRFLQGPGTDPQAVDIIRKAVATGSDGTACLLNYKADGKPFWNQLFVAALRDSDSCIVNYVRVLLLLLLNHNSFIYIYIYIYIR